ncbi:hypothetical protein [Caulobacter segnis]
MAYTLKQLTMAWTAVHGAAPTVEELAQLQLRTNASFTDQQALSYVLDSADGSTALAALSYQFFTGKSPTKEGLEYLTNSQANPNDLNDAYYTRFNTENRYINFAANLGVVGEGAAAFAGKYGAMSFADYIASIYETIIGSTFAKAAGIDAAKAIADIASRQAAILATAQASGMITPGMTQAQIDLAVKAAAAGYLMGEAIKADVGLYAAAANNFMLAVATGTATYNTDITTTYKPAPGSGSDGTGHSVTLPPPPTTLPGAPPAPEPEQERALAFTLTTGADTFTGGGLNDTFSATHTTFNATDALVGAGGNDTLTITAATGALYAVAGASVTGIETATISNNSGVTANTSTWTGLTQLNVTAVGALTVTAGAGANVTANTSNLTTGDATVNQGHDVTLNVTGSTGGVVSILGLTGAAVLNRHNAVGGSAGFTNVNGGTTISVTQTASNAVNTTVLNADLVVFGGANTTSVTVKAPKAVVADSTHAGVTANLVNILDINRVSTTAAGKITTVDVDGYSTLSLQGSAFSTVKVAHGGDVTFYNDGLTTPVQTSLNLTVNATGHNAKITDQGVYTTLNLTVGPNGVDEDGLTLDMAGVTTLNIAGSGRFAGGLNSTALQTVNITSSNYVQFSTSGTNPNATAVNGSTATGVIDTQVDGGQTTVTTGSGADRVYVDGATITKAISTGAGDDLVMLNDANVVVSATINGGSGLSDTIHMFADAAAAASGSSVFASKVVGFEILKLRNVTNQTIDAHALGGYHHVALEGGNGATIVGLDTGLTIELYNDGTAYTIDSANFTNPNDSLGLVLTHDQYTGESLGEITAAGVETVHIEIRDSAPVSSTPLEVTWLGNDVKTITITSGGETGYLALVADSTALTSLDASDITDGAFEWSSGALAGAATIKGSSGGDNWILFTDATAAVTYEGGDAYDNVQAINNVSGNVVHLGEGDNYFRGRADTVTAGAGDDYVNLTTGGGTIQAGDGDNVILATSTTTASTITTGAGDDKIFVDGVANVINVGSGVDQVEIGGVNAASATVFNAITGLGGANDKLFITGNNAGALGAQLTGQTTLAGYLGLGNDVAGTTNSLRWFVLGSDLYILSDVSASTSFQEGADNLVKLVGGASLNMGAATVSGGVITFH